MNTSQIIKLNNSGKVLTVFLVIIGVLLISLTAISLFFFQIETDKRKNVEADLASAREKLASVEKKIVKKEEEIFLLKEKNKEADARINDLSDELELEQGLREEMRIENQNAAKKLEDQIKETERIREKMAENLIKTEEEIAQIRTELQAEREAKQELLKEKEELVKEIQELKSGNNLSSNASNSQATQDQLINVEIDSILSNPDQDLTQVLDLPPDLEEGRVLTVDTDAEFVIVNLGEKQGLQPGMILSLFRGNDFLGDIQITRVQPEMSAADLIPPLSSLMVRKNDQVLGKK